MNNPILQEIYDVRRRHWEEAGGTWEGLCDYYRKFSEEFERKGPDALLKERLEARARGATPRVPRPRKNSARVKRAGTKRIKVMP